VARATVEPGRRALVKVVLVRLPFVKVVPDRSTA
jgi:hypothetical protein